jgi:asparagine synthase (glutamine-hydrolysing)
VWGAPAARPVAETADELTVLVSGRPQWQHAEHRERAARTNAASAVAALYRAGGLAQVLGALRGHFALALCDERSRQVTLVTDRLGIEPVCFARVGDTLVFARSIDTLARYPGLQPRVSAQALYDYLYSHMVPSPGTILEGVTKLEPAESLLWRDGKLEASRYWKPNFAPRRANGATPGDAELVEVLDAAVSDVVQDRCGAFLSGGIDSSTVTGLLARHTSGRAQAFSIGFDAQGFDESYYARLAAGHFGAEHHEFRVTPRDIAQHLPEVVCAIDEPFGNSSVIATYACAKFAADAGMTRLLAGDGGDELFGGNSRYAKQRVFELYGQVPAPLRTAVIEPLVSGAWAGSVWPVRKLKSYVKQANVPLPDRLQSYAYLERLGPQHMLHPDFLARVDLSLPLRQLRARYEEAQAEDVVDKMLYLDWKFTLADNDLRKVGRACELADMEVEYPWLDDRVVALSLRVPGQHKVNGTQLRYYAKRALSGFLPTETIQKKKHGFGLPFGVWMRDHAELRTRVESALADFRRRDILRPGFIDEVLVMQRDVHASYYGELIWVLVCLELWLASRGH